jgi:Tol biopolymer transport system component
MGTVGYMSPEQAVGEKVDHRTDIFAVGAIVYEMLSGARAFQGETPAAVMRAVISHDPEDLSSDGRIPITLGRVIQRCLEKNTGDRFQSARDVAFALEAVSSGGARVPPDPLQRTMQRRRRLILTIPILAIVLVAGIYLLRLWRVPPAAVSLEDLQIVQLTTTGNAESPAISPDGKYVAYVRRDGDTYSLRIHQITTGSDVEIVAAEPGGILSGVTVTPDGAFVDFIRQGPRRELWRVPFLGGTPKQLIDPTEDFVESSPGWSPDGKHMAFVQRNTAQATSKLVVAESDGAHARVLATRRDESGFVGLLNPERPNIPPAWSLDGRLIAAMGWDAKGLRVAVFDVATGSERNIPVKGHTATGLAWLDADSLMFNNSSEKGATSQLFLLSYPDGRVSRLSNDPNTYLGISATADRSSLVTARSETRVGIWVGDADGIQGSELTAPAPYPFAEGMPRMLAWSGEHLLYATARGNNLSISRTSPGKGRPEEIVSAAAMPAATWDDGRIVFVNLKTGSIWKADSDGRRAVELISQRDNYSPVVNPDGKVVFLSSQLGIQAPWVVSIDGGSPTEIAHVFAFSIDVSPDGRSIVFRSRNEQNNVITMICDLPACSMPRKLPPLGQPSPLRWTPDGSLAYVPTAVPSNIWVQPLDGAKPHQLTNFPDREIVDFAWSRDGKRLAIARANRTNDIVLFKGLKK